MVKIAVYYTAEKDGEQGEAMLTIEMAEAIAETVLEYFGKPGVFNVAECIVENMLTLAEKLRDRKYVPGSVKAYLKA